MASLVESFSKASFANLQAICDFLAKELTIETGKNCSIGLYSPGILNPRKVHLICASGKKRIPLTVADIEKKTGYYSLEMSFKIDRLLILSIQTQEKFKLSDLLLSLIGLKTNLVIFRKRQVARNYLAQTSLNKSDANSFAYKILEELRHTIVYCESTSIYVFHDAFQRIDLAATSENLHKRKEQYTYSPTDNNMIVKCNMTGEPILLYSKNDPVKITEDIYFFNPKKNKSLILWPIKFDGADGDQSNDGSDTIGVFQLQDIHRKYKNKKWKTYLTEYDSLMLNFISEIIFIIVNSAIRVERKQKSYRVFSHGIISSIQYASGQMSKVKESLYNIEVAQTNDELDADKVEALFEVKKEVLNSKQRQQLEIKNLHSDYKVNLRRYETNPNEIYQDIMDTESALEDIRFHFDKVLGIRQKPPIQEVNLLSEVLMPMFRLTSSMAKYRGKVTPYFSSFKVANFGVAPTVLSNDKILLSVFRNLVENSIKYTPKDRAEISISYSVELGSILIHFKDTGIGIAKDDLERIFYEGYRGKRANEIDNDGVGWGLGFCRDALEYVNGKIHCEYVPTGAHFVVTLPL